MTHLFLRISRAEHAPEEYVSKMQGIKILFMKIKARAEELHILLCSVRERSKNSSKELTKKMVLNSEPQKREWNNWMKHRTTKVPGPAIQGISQQDSLGNCHFPYSTRALDPRCKKSGKEGNRPPRMSQDLLVKLGSKKEMHRQWKQQQVSWKEYRDTAQFCTDGVRKAKAQLK